MDCAPELAGHERGGGMPAMRSALPQRCTIPTTTLTFPWDGHAPSRGLAAVLTLQGELAPSPTGEPPPHLNQRCAQAEHRAWMNPPNAPKPIASGTGVMPLSLIEQRLHLLAKGSRPRRTRSAWTGGEDIRQRRHASPHGRTARTTRHGSGRCVTRLCGQPPPEPSMRKEQLDRMTHVEEALWPRPRAARHRIGSVHHMRCLSPGSRGP